jgi:ectoine hydroxylase-related dioxygenase (phytanoyl-CoA dioxygenase family)
VWPGTHQPRAQFSVEEYKDIHIPKGKMLIFSSTLYHAGLGNGNMRLHFQYDDMDAGDQSTYFNEEIGKEYMEWVKNLSKP